MDLIKKGWFSEISDLWPGEAMSLQIEEILHSERSQYQDILVVRTKSYGIVLILDGIIQCTQKDEYAYQEMISFLPLCAHKNPEKVLIVGGGDGGVAREVSKHPRVKEIHQVEIDDRVVEVSKKYLPFMAKGFESEKLTLHIKDGFQFMRDHKNVFDVIITDSCDPVGPAAKLFNEDYFGLMKQALRDGGIVCSQGSTAWADMNHVKNTLANCRKEFRTVRYAVASVPSYPTGQIGFVIGSIDEDCRLEDPLCVFSDKELDDMNMRYYDERVHGASFVLPRHMWQALKY